MTVALIRWKMFTLRVWVFGRACSPGEGDGKAYLPLIWKPWREGRKVEGKVKEISREDEGKGL